MPAWRYEHGNAGATEARGIGTLGATVIGGCEPLEWVLGFELWSSGRTAAYALNCCVISLAQKTNCQHIGSSICFGGRGGQHLKESVFNYLFGRTCLAWRNNNASVREETV